MKKTYIQPSMAMTIIAATQFVCGSKGAKGKIDEEEIPYGGVDTNGELDPASRRRRRRGWDYEDEEQDW